MDEIHPHITKLLQCIESEELEQVKRFRLDKEHSLRQLKAEGLALHPITVTKKSFGYAEYPEISFRLNYPQETNLFRDGVAIECFIEGEEPVKGVLLGLSGKAGDFRLFAPDFPDWIEDRQVGIKLAPDQRTTSIMKRAMRDLPQNKFLMSVFSKLHSKDEVVMKDGPNPNTTIHHHYNLNQSQKEAVEAVLNGHTMTILHGPPGTGKTTTLIEAIHGLVKNGEKVLVSAPSNAAVDHIAGGLILKGLKVVRVGNVSKVSNLLYPYTPEGQMANAEQRKEVKQLRIRAEEFRKMALKYKRSFGKAEREQRALLFKEVKNIREEIKKLREYNEAKLFQSADVVLGTPIGLVDTHLHSISFKTLIIDEAGQCLEPLAWCIMPLAEKFVLAGDHLQLPPTVLSKVANSKGFAKSILEICIHKVEAVHLLDTQYRMRESIIGFSSQYFYKGLLKSGAGLEDKRKHISFYDTAGTGFQEEQGVDGLSLQNEGELTAMNKVIDLLQLDLKKTIFISPYTAQINLAHELLPQSVRKSTIDSFQGQEEENVLISLVRSNDDRQIGFLNDYRRMNVAITRAKEQLIIVGDSATLGNDPFYESLFTYIEQQGEYKSVWEL